MSETTNPGERPGRESLPPVVTISSGGESIAVRRIGAGPRLMLLHGGPGLDHHVMLPLAEVLSERFEVWLPDLPGHGGSRLDRDRLPGLVEVFDRLSRWFDHLEPRPDVLSGHSLGAWLSRELQRTGCIEPSAAVWISPPAGAGTDSAVRTAPRPAPPIQRENVDTLRREILEYVADETGHEPSERFRDALDRCEVRPPWRYTRLLHQLHRALLDETPPCEPHCPTLILCGDLDAITPPSHAAAVSAATRGSTLTILDQSGHFPYATDPKATADAIERFANDALQER